jgi:hypothetical protein
MTLILLLLGCAFEPPIVPELPPPPLAVPDAPEMAERSEPVPEVDHETDSIEEPIEQPPEPEPASPVSHSRPVSDFSSRLEIVPVALDQPTRPRHKGTGLLVGAGLASAIGLGFNVWRASYLASICREDGDLNDAIGCALGPIGMVPMSAMAWMGNFSSIGLAATGGAVLGRYHGISAASAGEPGRTGVGAIASGVSLLSLGVATGFGLRMWMFTDSSCVNDTCRTREVYGYFAGLQLSAMTTAAGAALLAYGVGVRKHRRRAMATIRVAPDFGWTHTGLSVSGRF